MTRQVITFPVVTCLFLFFFSIFLTSFPLKADQNDPRLEELFNLLRAEEDSFRANDIANRIWSVWTEHEDSRANTLMMQGIARMNAGDLFGALDTYDALIALQPDFAEAWNKRATLYWQLNQFDASLKDIEQVLRLEPFHFGALSGRGLVYMERGNYLQARGAFLTLLEVYPAMPGVRETVQQLERVLQKGIPQ